MALLTPVTEIIQVVIGRVMVKMCYSKDDFNYLITVHDSYLDGETFALVEISPLITVTDSTVPNSAFFTPAMGPLPDEVPYLWPVGRV